MKILRKPTIADIYVRESTERLDAWMTPVFPPDTGGMSVGTVGRFRDGRFDRRGHMTEIAKSGDLFREIELSDPTAPSSLAFQSAGAVELSPHMSASVAGQEMVRARLSFTRDRAVVASFDGVVEHSVRSMRKFDDLLWRCYLTGELDPHEVVVATIRKAAMGTVLVCRSGGVHVELSAAPPITSITLDGLAAGVQMQVGSDACVKTSGRDLTVGIRAKGLLDETTAMVDDVRRFEGGGLDEPIADLEGAEVPTIVSSLLIADADFDLPEDDG